MPSLQSYILNFGIRRLNIFGSEEADLRETRARVERLSRRAKPHRDVQATPVEAGTVPAVWLAPAGAPPDRALLYLHGGAWCLGSPRTHLAFASRLAYASGIRALLIDYRLAPEHPFPAGLEDCLAACEWLQASGIPAEKIVVAGDSAGGNLALTLLVALREAGKPLPAGAVTLSPATDLAGTGDSYRTRKHLDPFFANMGVTGIVAAYLAGQDPCHPLASPLYADLRGLPPLLIHVGDHEILHDDAVRFGERARAAGVEVTTVVWPGMFHVFQMGAPFLPEARRANAQIAAFIRAMLKENQEV